MRKNIIAGNWKMNSSSEEGRSLVKGVLDGIHELKKTTVIFSPPFLYLKEIKDVINNRENVSISAQNMSQQENGAFTGEVSHSMLKDIGCDYVILGHSERRQYYGETNEIVNEKVLKALANNIKPILCVGETFEEYEAGKTLSVIKEQVTKGLNSVSEGDMSSVVLAYEPVWAIGTGKTSTPENADNVHGEIRKIVESLYNSSVSNSLQILYGGSVKASNSESLLAMENIDGALVGGASLKVDEFVGIIKSSEQ
ncbi:MAG: triose-phosphate isomerase [Nitrospinae bacterium]|nr:triose-phosphate isomerase [Nitrospinota bacterium]